LLLNEFLWAICCSVLFLFLFLLKMDFAPTKEQRPQKEKELFGIHKI